MQSRPKLPGTNRFIDLPDDFPVTCSSIFTQGDAPIRLLHRHNAVEIGYCHDGEGIWVVENKLISFQTGDVVFVTGSELHLAQSRKGTTSKWTWIYFDPVKLLIPSIGDYETCDTSRFQGQSFVNVFPSTRYPRLNQIVVEVIEEFTNKGRSFREVLRCLLYTLLIQMHRLADQAGLPSTGPVVRQESANLDWNRIRPAIQMIFGGYQGPVAVPALADRCAMSITNFRRTFLRVTGRTPQEYLMSVRIRMASIELRSGSSPISRVALSNGFTTFSSFNRKFRQVMGTTPRQWRANTVEHL